MGEMTDYISQFENTIDIIYGIYLDATSDFRRLAGDVRAERTL